MEHTIIDTEMPSSGTAMDHATQVTLIRRMLDHIRRGSTDMGDGPMQQSVKVYTCPERYEQEMAVLRRCPMILTSVARLRQPGDYVTYDALGMPIVLCVDRDARINAFKNTCRHRGARLVEGPHGHQRGPFVCPYHGWSYSTDGALLHIPHAHGFAERHCDKTQLEPVPIVVRHGDTGVDIDDHLGPLAAEMASWNADAYHLAFEFSLSVAANWKLVMEGTLETYHVRRTHSTTFYTRVYDNICLADDFHPHQRIVFPYRTIEAFEQRDTADWSLWPVATVIYLLFPNTIVVRRGGVIELFPMIPQGTGRTAWHAHAMVEHLPADDDERERLRLFRKSSEDVIGEDCAAVESIQRGLHSGANDSFTFGRFEVGLTRFHRALECYLARIGVIPGAQHVLP